MTNASRTVMKSLERAAIGGQMLFCAKGGRWSQDHEERPAEAGRRRDGAILCAWMTRDQPSRDMTMPGIWPACLSMEMPDCISMEFLLILALSMAKSASMMRPLAISVLSRILARLLLVWFRR